VVRITPATEADVEELLARMRAADRIECDATGVEGWEAGLFDAARAGVMCWAARAGDRLLCLFGATRIADGIGAVWMLGTDELVHFSKRLMKTVPGYLQQMLDAFPVLMNFVHASNRTSVQWLRRLGFRLFPAEPYGKHGQLFHRFEMRRQ